MGVQAVIEGYLRPMLADNWDKGSLYSYRAFSFPSDMPYKAITQPVLFITGEKDQPLTKGAQKVRKEKEKQNAMPLVPWRFMPRRCMLKRKSCNISSMPISLASSGS